MDHETVERRRTLTVAGARVEVLGGQHAVIHPDIPVIPNNAYLVDGTHLHPGDALTRADRTAGGAVPADGGAVAEAVGGRDLPARGRARAPRCRSTRASWPCPGMYYGHFERLGPEKTTVRVLDPASPTRL